MSRETREEREAREAAEAAKLAERAEKTFGRSRDYGLTIIRDGGTKVTVVDGKAKVERH